jgi:SAM-dependent methyltransferase
MSDESSSYDDIAGIYHALWVDWYLPAARPALEKLFFLRVHRGASVLDVCCGSGHVTKELVARGYKITGIDASAALIAQARRDLPGVDFQVQDARAIRLDTRYDAALSTFDSLNHIMRLDELRKVFEGIQGALMPDGLFVFDMNVERAYLSDHQRWTVNLTDESVGLVRGSYDRAEKKASTEIVWFRKTGKDNLWEQHRSVVEQRCYPQALVMEALSEAGFREIEATTAESAGITAELGFGRIFFSARA